MKALSILAVLSLAIQLSRSEPVLNIQGHYDESTRGTPSKQIFFRVSLSSNACRICATNSNNPNEWEMVVYDGTNTFALAPIAGKYSDSNKGEALLCGLVSPGHQYYTLSKSLVSTYIPWVTYCLRPGEITPDMPSPFIAWRSHIGPYGWSWTNITTSEDGRFLRGYSIVRNKSFDLEDIKEFLRPAYEYPQTLDALQNQQNGLIYRKTVPDGWTARTYTCNQWYKTNGFTVPAHAEFQFYVYDNGRNGESVLFSSARLQADLITVSEENEWFQAPSLTEETYVRDYRYTRRSENRMFRYAEYVGSGSWKSESDPKLLAEADWYMRHGPKFGEFGPVSMVFNSGRRLILIWLSLFLVSAVAIAMLVRTKLKKQVI